MATINTYIIGQKPVLTARFTYAGVYVNPADPAIIVKEPDGTLITHSIADLTNDSTGVFSLAFAPTKVGVHRYYSTATDPYTFYQQSAFRVEASSL